LDWFHDIHPWTVAAMPENVEHLAAGGCRCVTLSQYLAEQPTVTKAKP
jgi:hypothetical protein